MPTEIVFAIQESPEGGYEARALGYSIYTQAETLDELKQLLRDAVRCHFSDADKPSVIRLHLVKDEVISA
jgi:hypothetical protein